MTPTSLDDRPLVPTIAAAREPVEHYWDAYAPDTAAGATLDDTLDPLDGFLVHLVLGLVPPGAVVVDFAAGPTAGATTAAALAHPATRRVYAGLYSGVGAVRVGAALRSYAADKSQPAKLVVLPSADPPADLDARQGLVIVADARDGPPAETAAAAARWLDAHPGAVVLVLGVGPVGGGVVEALVGACGENSGRAVRLFRETAEALAGSRLAAVARRDHPTAAETVRRVGLLYSGNVRYIDLLWQMNAAALKAAGADAGIMATHPSAIPVLHEIDSLRRQLTAAQNEIGWMRDRHAWAEAHIAKADEAWAALHHSNHALYEIQRSLAYRTADRVRLARSWLVPEATRRYGLYRRLRRAGQLWRAEKIKGLALWVVGRR